MYRASALETMMSFSTVEQVGSLTWSSSQREREAMAIAKETLNSEAHSSTERRNLTLHAAQTQ